VCSPAGEPEETVMHDLSAQPTGDEPHVGGSLPRLRRAGVRAARPVVVLGLAVALVAAGAGLDRAGLLPGGPNADPALASPQFRLLEQAWDLLHEQAVQRATLDDTTLAYAAIGALADAVGDTGHTSFETPAELATEQAVLSGSYVGIGVALDPASDGARVATVYPGSPAAHAGLVPGDVILAINGTRDAGLALDRVIALVAGPSGSSVTLSIRPAAGGPAHEVALTRAPITLPLVEWAMVPGTRIADVRIDQFSTGTTDALVKDLEAAGAAHAQGVVLDLRGNPGGLVSEAVGVASQFIASGDVYQTQDASGRRTDVAVRPGGVALDTPLAVLVDKGTASSAEIVASALKDAGRAVVIGETTFGTGTILGQFSLADGSALRIGTEQWLTRDGTSTWHVGLVPDQVVALASGQHPLSPAQAGDAPAGLTGKAGDTQLGAAIHDLAASAGA
jgi:carboxyl-terminal processing protease